MKTMLKYPKQFRTRPDRPQSGGAAPELGYCWHARKLAAGLSKFAAAVAVAGAAGSAAFADHGGRPLNVPPMGSADLFFFDGQALFRGFESGGPGAVDIYIFGWSFDGNNPNSPFVASSSADTRTNEPMFPEPWYYAYNATQFTYDQINVEFLNQAPNALVGPGRLAMFDDSKLTVTHSILRSQVIGAGDRSTVEISNSQLAGELQMRSAGSMTLSLVTPFQRPSESPNLRLIAENGTTEISSSTLLSVTSRGRASVTVSNSTIRNAVSQDRNSLDASLVPATTIGGDSRVGSLSASIGTIRMTNGQVDGVVQASGDANDPLRAGGIFLDQSTVGGSVSASKFGMVTILGGSINGNVTAGDSTDAPGTVRIAASSISGNVQAVGSGILDINGFDSVGSVQASGVSRITISNGVTIRGNVIAVGESQATLSNVTRINGDAFADQSATISLTRTSARNVGAFSDATLDLTLTSADSVTVDGGTVFLQGCNIAGRIDVFGKGRLSFGAASTLGGSITNFGDAMGLVQVQSGNIRGNLVGLASSITAMSGGHVQGSPVFGDQAIFLYFGGTFGFAATSPAESASFSVLRSDDENAVSAGLFSTTSGFTALGDATIKFIGFGLQSTLLDPDYVQDDLSYSVYQLTGRLADNSSIDGGLVYIQNAAGTASFELIEAPEPSATALVIICLSCVGFSRRAR